MFRVPTRLAQVAALGEARILQDMLTPMHPIEPLNVYLGSLAAAHDAELLASKGVTHIVNCLGPADVRFPDRFAYLTLDVPEAESSAIKAHFDAVNAWVDAALAGGGAVLIHCRSGEHRSASVVSAYRMHKLGEAAADAVLAVQRVRSNVDIPPSYRLALVAYDSDLADRRRNSSATVAAGGVSGDAAAAAASTPAVPAVLPPAEAASRGRAAPPTDPGSFLDSSADAARMLREHGEDRVIGDMLSHIQQILPRVYLGDLSAASDRAMLRRHGVTHVICCVGDSGVSFRGDLQYAVIFVGDTPSADIKCHFHTLTQFMYDALAGAGGDASAPTPAASSGESPVAPASGAAAAPSAAADTTTASSSSASGPATLFVHCHAGASRSVSVLTAFIMRYCGLRAGEALRLIQRTRTVANPNEGFRRQLLQYEEELFGGATVARSAVPVDAAGSAVAAVGGAAATASSPAAAPAAAVATGGDGCGAVGADAPVSASTATAASADLSAATAPAPPAMTAPAPLEFTAAAEPYHTLYAAAKATGAAKAPTPPSWSGTFNWGRAPLLPVALPPVLALPPVPPSKSFDLGHVITPRLLLGSLSAAEDIDFLSKHNVVGVVSCVGKQPRAVFAASALKLAHLAFFIDDGAEEPIHVHFDEAHAFIADTLSRHPDGGAVLVHCMAGVSRSATVVAAFLMRTCGLRAHEAVAHVQSRREIASPNDGFLAQLVAYEKLLFDAPAAAAAAGGGGGGGGGDGAA